MTQSSKLTKRWIDGILTNNLLIILISTQMAPHLWSRISMSSPSRGAKSKDISKNTNSPKHVACATNMATNSWGVVYPMVVVPLKESGFTGQPVKPPWCCPLSRCPRRWTPWVHRGPIAVACRLRFLTQENGWVLRWTFCGFKLSLS